jgi:hypothetical protein
MKKFDATTRLLGHLSAEFDLDTKRAVIGRSGEVQVFGSNSIKLSINIRTKLQMMHSLPYQGVSREIYGFADLIFTKLATTQQRSVHLLTLRRILPQSDNTCGECGFKFLDNHQRSVGFTPLLFTTVAATSYTSWMSAVRKRLQSGVKKHTHYRKHFIFHETAIYSLVLRGYYTEFYSNLTKNVEIADQILFTP